jgi:prevent-host-death family protein
MADFGLFEAKTHLSRLVERALSGEDVTITKHGTPLVRLVPVRRTDPGEFERIRAELRAIASRNRLGGVSVRQLRDEGRP